ncbi:MAG TPA: hypothetical protein VNI20_05860, partial [Fimbriimonadaceae bacterium]|nr:hypothetical protein [Fimbriimonadaceae bacterium]
MQLLVTDPVWTWREWLKQNLGKRDLVCLDTGDADHGPPGRAFLLRGGKVRAWRLVGSVYSNRNPVDLLAGAATMLASAAKDAVVLSFALRESPVLRQMALALAEMCQPDEILLPKGSQFVNEPWPVMATTHELPKSLPESAQTAQRRAQWL